MSQRDDLSDAASFPALWRSARGPEGLRNCVGVYPVACWAWFGKRTTLRYSLGIYWLEKGSWMDEQIVEATPLMGKLMLASLLVFAAGIVLLIVGRKRTGRFSWAGFVLTMFVAVLLYDLGIWELTGRVESMLLSLFHSLQTMSANRDFELPEVAGASQGQMRLLASYGTLLFIVAPVSIVTAVLEYFSGVITSLVLWFKSLVADSFVFSRLDERTLDLAQDVQAHYRGAGRLASRPVCIVFANCDDADDGLLTTAHKMRAFCFGDGVEETSHKCSRRRTCSIVLLEEDEVAAITMARSIKEEAQESRLLSGRGETRIFVLTDFRNTESLLFPEVLGEEERWNKRRGKVIVRGIDLTRELVEQVMLRYPLFLLSKPLPGVSVPVAAGSGADGLGGVPDSCWYHTDASEVIEARRLEMYVRPDRHILVVGAGSIGTEFLSSALWASRIDGIHTKIDVIDSIEDPLSPGKPLAESCYASEAPEVMNHRASVLGAAGGDGVQGVDLIDGEEPYDLMFSLVDAETDAYVQFLAARAKTLSYVFIALGDDLLNARVAMRTRQVLERELATRVENRDEFLRASRPIIVTVIRNDDFAATVERAINEGQPYDIVCVGNNSDVLTYKMLHALVGNRNTEYKRRSSRANNTHVKYRLFAFARNLLLNNRGVRDTFGGELSEDVLGVLCRTLDVSSDDKVLDGVRAALGGGLDRQKVLEMLGEVDWSIDVKGGPEEFNRVKGWTLALLYQLYCTNGVTRALDTMNLPKPSREWLLHMEHDRWNAYVRTQGFVSASYGTTERIFATGQVDTQKHRSNLMGLHPCLVSFEDLARLDAPLYRLYEGYFKELDEREVGVDKEDKEKRLHVAKTDWLQLLDDNYIGIKRPKY